MDTFLTRLYTVTEEYPSYQGNNRNHIHLFFYDTMLGATSAFRMDNTLQLRWMLWLFKNKKIRGLHLNSEFTKSIMTIV